MKKSDNVIEHKNKLVVIDKELDALENYIPNKIQVFNHIA
jgi:hypothetical protein